MARKFRMIRYVGSGVAGNVVAYTIFVLLWSTASWIGPLGVSAIASLLVLPMSFALNRRYVFRSRMAVLPEVIRFCAVYLVAMASSVALLAALLRVLPTPVVVTQAIAILLLVLLTYLVHSFWTFTHRRTPAPVYREHPSDVTGTEDVDGLS